MTPPRRLTGNGVSILGRLMSTWFIIWLMLAAVIGLVWLIRCVSVGQVLRKRSVLTSRSYPGPPPDAGDPARHASVIVAAKDEEDNIETCIRGLLDQDYPNFEVIAVDDRSRDRTPQILQRLLEDSSAGRVPFRVITVKTLSDGWFGKNNAMREGVAVATGPWLLFTDADCRQTSRKTISMAMREAVATEADFLSITPVLEARALWERIVQPVCSMALMIWFLPHRVNKPERKTAYANGAFMLMHRDCYDTIGGHERVRTQVNEDIHMARFAKQAGLRLRVVENDDLYRTRMYDTPRQAWRGWSRIFYGCLETLPRLMAAAALIVVVGIIPWASLIVALLGLVYATSSHAGTDVVAPWMTAAVAWFVVVALMQFVTWRAYAIMRAGPLWSLYYLLGAFVTVSMLINAMFKVTGASRTTWRGTTYQGDRLVDTGDTADREPKPAGDAAAAASGAGALPRRPADSEAAEQPATRP
jgi:chlorobactene glucosyltransferase